MATSADPAKHMDVPGYQAINTALPSEIYAVGPFPVYVEQFVDFLCQVGVTLLPRGIHNHVTW